MRLYRIAIGLVVLATGCAAPLPQTPPPGIPPELAAPTVRVGDDWRYAVHDGYTRLPQGTVEYRVSAVEGDRITVERRHEGRMSTEHYTRDLNWRQRPMTNLPTFRYDPPYVALPFPLAAGKTWRAYVNATNSATGATHRVRIDGKVLGWERVAVPAGAFDALVVRRIVYAGNEDTTRGEENITEIDWYAPALGGIVRHVSSSAYFDKMSSCDERSCNAWVRNDWNVAELIGHRRAPPQ